MISDTITIDAGEAIGQLDAFAEAAAKAEASLARLNGGAGGAGADKLAASMDKAAASMSAAADRIEAASTRAAASMGRLSTSARGATGGLDTIAGPADRAAAAEDKVAGSANAAAAALDKQAVAGERAGKSSEVAAAGGTKFWDGLKTVLLGAGVAAAYGIDKAMKFQSEMLLLHTQAGVSMKDTQAMSQGVLQISGQTGQSLSSVAESAYHVASNMASMGGTPKQMLDAVRIAAEGAAVGHSNLVDTTTALTSVIASGIPGAKNYSQAMGAINATVGSGEMNMQQLAEAMGTGVVPVVKGYGLTLKDVGAALATYGDLNIRGAHAGTQLRMAVQALAVPMKTGPLKEYGLTMNTLANDMERGGLLKALDDLNTRFHKAGLTAANEGQAITALFGKKAGAGLALLMENLDRFQGKFPYLTQQANSFNKAWEATQQSPAQKWHELTAKLQVSAVNFGTALLPAFSTAVGWADKLLADINGSKSGAKDMALAFGGVAALFTGKKLVSGIEGAFKTAETGLRFTGKIAQVLDIPGLSKLANIGQGAGLDTAAGALRGSAGSLTGAAADLSAAAARLAGEPGLPGGRPGEPVPVGEPRPGEPIPEPVPVGAKIKGPAIKTGLGLLATATIVDPMLQSLRNSHGNWLDNAFGTPSQSGWNSWSSFAHDLSTMWGLLPNGGGSPQPRMGPRGWYNAPPPPAAPTAGEAMLGAGGHPGTATLDTSSISAASAKISAALSQVKLPPIKLPPPDLSGLDLAKAKAASAAQGITTSMDTALHKPVKANPPDLSAYTSAAGKARGDGVAISQGLASGIEAGKGAAVAAANDVASSVAAVMAHALQTRSPSKVTQKIGANTVEGLIVGLEGGQPALTAAATALGKITAKAADVTAIDSAISKAIGYAGKDSPLVKWLKGEQSKLTGLAAQRTRLETEIADSQQIAQNAISGMSIMGAGAYTPASAAGAQSAYGTIYGMQQMAADQKAFAAQLAMAQKMGLNAQSESQIAQSGAAAGLPLLQGLTGPGGGKAAIAQLNQLEASIVASSSKIGDVGGPAMYAAGQQVANGLAAGLKASLSGVDNAMKAMAQQIVATIKKDLKIASPSGVMAELGAEIPAGVAQGIDGGSAAAGAAMTRMGGRLAGGWKPAPGGYGGGSGGGATTVSNTYHITVTVQGTVLSEHDLAGHIQNVLLDHGSRNWQAGIIVPGRAH